VLQSSDVVDQTDADQPMRRRNMKVMTCPCGETLSGATDDEFVASVNEHMNTAHPEMAGKYTPEQILSRAQQT
jgi:hypothetical protein